MELLVLILLIGLFALFVAHSSLKHRVEIAERRLAMLEAATQVAPVEADREPEPPVAQVAVPATADAPAEAPAAAMAAEPRILELGDEPDEGPGERQTIGALFEQLVGGRLLIWLGGIALILAAVFLVRYSIGLVTPGMRMIAAALFGLVLLGLGEYARAGRWSDDPRIAQVLVGAGLSVLYLATYGSHGLYGLIGPATASLLMLAVTGAALGLSLRHGAPTAIIGLIGGFLTPLLVGDPDAGAVPLLAYLALLNLALFVIAWRRGWTWLAAGAVALSFVWAAWLLVQPADDALAAGGFVILLAVAAALLRPGEGRELGLIQPLTIGILQLAFLVARTDLGLTAWILFGALAAACLALSARRDEYRLAAPLAAVLALALLGAKALTGEDPAVPAAAAGITLLFGLGGLALSLAQRRALWTAIACAGLSGPALIIRAARPELLDRPAWGMLMLALAAGPAASVWLNRARAGTGAPADLALLVSGAAAALLAGAAAWDLLPGELIAAAWLVVAIAAGLAAGRLGDLALATVAVTTAAIAVARALFMIPELSTAAMTGLFGIPVLAADLPSGLDTLYALALPALLLAALRFALAPLPLGARRALPAVAGLFALAALYVWFKQAFGLADEADFVARGFLERTILTQALFLAGWLLGAGIVRPRGIEPDLLRLCGGLLTALAAARLLWLDIVVLNPAAVSQNVGALPVLNLVLAQYGSGALWLYLARRRAVGGEGARTRSGLWLIGFLAALVAGTLLLVRQAFQGAILTGPDVPIAEYYAYSLAGLLVSIALLLVGIRLADKAIRLAGLALLAATIVKVFWFDAAGLEGVLRILSFLGLGIALIGIGRLYGPVLRAERATGG